MPDDDAIRTLLAKQEITERIYEYCRGLDRMDRALASTVWHPGGTAHYGDWFRGTGEGFLDWVWVSHEALAAHSHQISNVLIRVDGDRAVSESYVTVTLRSRVQDGHAADTVTRGRYVDEWDRRDGRWAIAHRTYVQDIGSTYVVPEALADTPGAPAGARDETDPSYRVFR